MTPGSFRWWFQHRETGVITVAQAPNPPLFIAATGWIADLFFDGRVGAAGWWLSVVALIYWGGDELVRGVNPWRRVLGVAVLGWQIARVLA